MNRRRVKRPAKRLTIAVASISFVIGLGLSCVGSDKPVDIPAQAKWAGIYDISYYCNEPYKHICNNGDWEHTATGTTPTPGRTIAVDPAVIPYGSVVEIDGVQYIAEDTGSHIKGKHIDILVDKHQEAIELGKDIQEVWIYE